MRNNRFTVVEMLSSSKAPLERFKKFQPAEINDGVSSTGGHFTYH